jgi:hypothetical protein
MPLDDASTSNDPQRERKMARACRVSLATFLVSYRIPPPFSRASSNALSSKVVHSAMTVGVILSSFEEDLG